MTAILKAKRTLGNYPVYFRSPETGKMSFKIKMMWDRKVGRAGYLMATCMTCGNRDNMTIHDLDETITIKDKEMPDGEALYNVFELKCERCGWTCKVRPDRYDQAYLYAVGNPTPGKFPTTEDVEIIESNHNDR